MMSSFKGFSQETLQFFSALEANNNKTWFNAHKPDFENFIMQPAREFVVAMGERLREIMPGVVADPRINKSIFRIYRDTRFSNDKTPYKTNLGLWFWVGEGHKFENPGYYFHLDAENLMLAVGLHTFSKALLKAYREAVVDEPLGTALRKAVQSVAEKGYNLGEITYKRTPRGYDSDHPNAAFLLHSGLTSGVNLGLPEQLYTPALIDFSFEHFRNQTPIVKWLQTTPLLQKDYFTAEYAESAEIFKAD